MSTFASSEQPFHLKIKANLTMGFYQTKYFLLSTVIVVLFVFLTQLSLYAQNEKIESITVADGLAQGFTADILEDDRGFIWFCTANGLSRFDGYQFKQYNHEVRDTNSLIDDRLLNIVEDEQGRFWISTYFNGIECFDPKTEIFHHFGYEFSDLAKTSMTLPGLVKTNNNKIWVLTNSGFFEILNTDSDDLEDVKFKSFVKGRNLPRSIGPHRIKLLEKGEAFAYAEKDEILYQKNRGENFVKVPIKAKDLNGDAFVFNTIGNNPFNWIYNEGSIFCFKDNLVIKEIKLDSFNLNKAGLHLSNFLFEDEFENIWLIINHLLYKINNDDIDNDRVKLIPIIDEPICLTMNLLSGNKLYIGTNGYGVRILNLDKPEVINLFEDHSPNRISYYQDNKYILSNNHIVNLQGEYFPNPGNAMFVSNKNITYYYSNYKELIAEVKGTNRKITIENFDISTAFVDHQDRFWGFSVDSGIELLWDKSDTILSYYSFKNLWEDDILAEIISIYESKDGKLWLSTAKGLVEVEVLPKEKELKFEVWTAGKKSELISNNILCSKDDPYEPERYIWLGTKGQGLTRMNKNTGECIHYGTKDGLPNNVVYGILYDDLGNFWLSTNFGLSQFNLKTRHFKNFTSKEDGLQADEFNSNAYLKLNDGRLAFGGVRGVSLFDPKQFEPSSEFGKVYFTQLKVNNKIVSYDSSKGLLREPISYTKTIDLNYDENFLSINYAGLGTRNFGKMNYYYKMEGVDRDWVYAGNKTELSYPNLESGSYVLKVADTNELGERNPNAASIAFNIASPWWASNLAYLLYAIIICSLGFYLYSSSLSKAKMEQALSYKEKEMLRMKELDEHKNRFYSNITHEFRTPLTLIVEPARQLLKSKSPETKKQSSVIFNSANRLLLMVNEYLYISKLENDKVKILSSRGDILIVIREIFNYFLPLAERNEQYLVWDTDLTELQVNFDKNIVEKMLYNLISNALKFTPKKGTITLKVNALDDNFWQLIVSDTGKGIEEAKIDKIYDRFYQTDNSSTKRVEGSGIGLATVKELTHLIGGKIEVKSELNLGSSFSVTLPLSFSSTTTDAYQPGESNELLKNVLHPIGIDQERENPEQVEKASLPKILVVEDNQDLSEYIEGILDKQKYQVLTAFNGEEGLQKAKEYSPDLIISDLMMPIMDGFQLLEACKKDINTSHIPFIILTAKANPASKLEGYRKGAHAYLAKPFNSDELLLRIAQVIKDRGILQLRIQNIIKETPKAINKEQVLVSDTAQQNGAKTLELTKLDMIWVEKLDKLIKDKIVSDSFTMDQLSSEMLMSRTQFFAKVKGLTGLTPAVLVKNKRLEMAYKMIVEEPDMTFAMIADNLGVSDAKYFKRNFVKKYGQKPSDIRKSTF